MITSETARTDPYSAPGTPVSDLGHGVAVVRRDPPRKQGATWVAPYSVNCAEHGWIESRRTVQECEHDGREHIAASHGDAHAASLEPDAQYPHLARAHCSCGWHSAGYVRRELAPRFHAQHLTAVQREAQSVA